MLSIRAARPEDGAAVWKIIEPVIRAGETYTLPRDMSRQEALAYWFNAGNQVFVAEVDGEIAGTYFLRANQKGGGSHVANCGYVTDTAHTGKGIARAMCLDSLDRARIQGFRAMQFNFVVSTNARAVKLWEGLGFKVMGRLPEAFRHPEAGYVDAYVMYLDLSVLSLHEAL